MTESESVTESETKSKIPFRRRVVRVTLIESEPGESHNDFDLVEKVLLVEVELLKFSEGATKFSEYLRSQSIAEKRRHSKNYLSSTISTQCKYSNMFDKMISDK